MRVADLATDRTGETVTKSDREIMEILESYDLTRCAHSAAKTAWRAGRRRTYRPWVTEPGL
jgi:hypothetical protein